MSLKELLWEARDTSFSIEFPPGRVRIGRRVVLDGELVADAGQARDFDRLGCHSPS